METDDFIHRDELKKLFAELETMLEFDYIYDIKVSCMLQHDDWLTFKKKWLEPKDIQSRLSELNNQKTG